MGLNFKVINAGNCIICGRPIEFVITRGTSKFPNIFLCQDCIIMAEKERRMDKDKGEKTHRPIKEN